MHALVYSVEPVEHVGRLGIAHDSDLGILLFQQFYAARVILFHVVDYDVVESPVAQHGLDVGFQLKIEAFGHCIDERSFLVSYDEI